MFSHLYYRCLNVNLSGYGVQDQDEIRSMVADVTKGCEDVIVNMLAEEYEKKIPVMYREMHKMTLWYIYLDGASIHSYTMQNINGCRLQGQ